MSPPTSKSAKRSDAKSKNEIRPDSKGCSRFFSCFFLACEIAEAEGEEFRLNSPIVIPATRPTVQLFVLG